MLQSSRAFSSYSVDNLEKARTFYTETLGLDAKQNDMGILEMQLVGGQSLIIYPKDDHRPASFTVMNFVVADIDKAVDDLIANGVELERYKNFDHDAKGIARSNDGGPSIGWFRDPAGNILAVMESWE